MVKSKQFRLALTKTSCRRYSTSSTVKGGYISNNNKNECLINSTGLPTSDSLNPWFITGLVDAEGSFSCIIKRNTASRLKWRIEVVFQIGLHTKDLKLLEQIKAYFGDVGVIAKSEANNMCAFRVTSLKQIASAVLPHFAKYPLKTQKGADFQLWLDIVNIMLNVKSLTEDDLQNIVNIRASLNLGLSGVLKAAFPNYIPVTKPSLPEQKVPHPEWMAGFTTGEGCFFLKVNKGRNKSGIGVQLVFQLAQHLRDALLLESFVAYFNCGRLVRVTEKNWGYFECTKFLDNYEIILEFFKKHPIRGVKGKDFADWMQVAEMIKTGEHLTPEGSKKILEIKSAMNTGRPIDL